jgi:PTH2 family peptidyl-tRNA hydrolase
MVKQVIVLRKDLNMRKGKMCAQAAHATLNIYINKFLNTSHKSWKEDLESWFLNNQTKIVLGCDSKEDLIKIAIDCAYLGLAYERVIDIGAAEFHNVSTVTGIVIGPAKSELIDQVTKNYKLL